LARSNTGASSGDRPEFPGRAALWIEVGADGGRRRPLSSTIDRMNDAELVQSVLRKARDSAEVIERFFTAHAERIMQCSRAMARGFDQGARMFAMGNGGSACDAEHVTVELMLPAVAARPALPAVALSSSSPLISSIGNDDDYSQVFMKQIQLLARPGDIALGISNSGKAANVNRALRCAREMGLLTVGFTGHDGGSLPAVCDYVFVVPSFSAHRIHEAHVALAHVMVDLVHVARGEADVL
jgi:D-sedoheptulose 7-phosphate isomerase